MTGEDRELWKAMMEQADDEQREMLEGLSEEEREELLREAKKEMGVSGSSHRGKKSSWQQAYENLQEEGVGKYLGRHSGSGPAVLGALIHVILLKQSKGNPRLGCLYFFVDIGVLALVGLVVYIICLIAH